MIDKRELLEKARDTHLPLAIVEKDYVLDWLLLALANVDDLAFKGGTALSKVYFPRVWRLSEDLDFAFPGRDFRQVTRGLGSALSDIRRTSGIELRIKSKYSNPEYLQLKVQYTAVLGKNWIKVDATKEGPIDTVRLMEVKSAYSDLPRITIRTESLEEIFAQKLRALLERKKCRDFFDAWKLSTLDFDKKKLRALFREKCRVKGIDFEGTDQIFSQDIRQILEPYWEKELGRLVSPLPGLDDVLRDLSSKLSDMFEKA